MRRRPCRWARHPPAAAPNAEQHELPVSRSPADGRVVAAPASAPSAGACRTGARTRTAGWWRLRRRPAQATRVAGLGNRGRSPSPLAASPARPETMPGRLARCLQRRVGIAGCRSRRPRWVDSGADGDRRHGFGDDGSRHRTGTAGGHDAPGGSGGAGAGGRPAAAGRRGTGARDRRRTSGGCSGRAVRLAPRAARVTPAAPCR